MAEKPLTTASTSQTVLPAWYENYAQDILANQKATAARPYTPYEGERIAAPANDTLASYDVTRGAAGAYQPALTLGTLATADTLGRSSLSVADPYRRAALEVDPSGAASGALGQASSLASQGTTAYGMNYAKPYLDKAAGDATDPSDYLNPYIEHVVNRYGELGARTLREQLVPGVLSKYISAGQLGFGPNGGSGTPSGMYTDTARALRDVQEGVANQQLTALADGYKQSQEANLADLNRYGQLGATAGSIGSAQASNAVAAANVAANVGATQGALAQQNAELKAQMAAQAAAQAQADTQNQLAAGSQLGQQGAQAQSLGLTGAGALNAAGTQQQTQDQQGLSLAYQDFLNQQNYPQTQIDQSTKTLQGVSPAVPVGQVGWQQQTQTGAKAPTTAATLASGVAAIKALGS